jgi:hypothetical protein
MNAAKLLAKEARAAGLRDFAESFDILADSCGRMSVELDMCVHGTFVAARRGEMQPS